MKYIFMVYSEEEPRGLTIHGLFEKKKHAELAIQKLHSVERLQKMEFLIDKILVGSLIKTWCPVELLHDIRCNQD